MFLSLYRVEQEKGRTGKELGNKIQEVLQGHK